MTKTVMPRRLVLLCVWLLLLTTAVRAQNLEQPAKEKYYLSPDGLLEELSDQWGNKFTLRQLMVPQNFNKVPNTSGQPNTPARGSGMMMSSGVSMYTGCNSGYFQLYLEAGSGFENYATDPAHQAKLDVLCQVLRDLSNFISSPLSSTGNKINLWIAAPSVLGNAPVSIIGAATSLYNLPAIPTISGIADNTLWIMLQSGKDPYTNVAPPIINGGLFFHGIVVIKQLDHTNTPIPWNTSLTSAPTSSQYDLYTLLLHEISHALGFQSLIGANGKSRFGSSYPYYSRYDLNLKTSGGIPLITQPTNCKNYNLAFNTSLNPYNTLTPDTSNCYNTDTVTCASSIKYFGGLSTSQHVFTPNCWRDGGSLSHFEDQCAPISNNDGYFVMSNRIPKGIMKRYPKPEERQVLCDLGYNVGTSYGNSAHLSNYTYSGTSCNSVMVAGINDGINSSGTFTYIATNAAVTINGASVTGFMANDHNATGFECLQEISGPGGTFNVTSGTTGATVTYTPPSTYTQSSIALLRYVPVNGARRGNITYVYVYINNGNCPATACNLVRNESFENSSGCGNMPGVTANCWVRLANTPDIFDAGCVSFYTSHPNSATGNARSLHFMVQQAPGMTSGTYDYLPEGIQTMLSTPLVKGVTYKLGFWAKIIPQAYTPSQPFFVPCHLRFSVSSGPMAVFGGYSPAYEPVSTSLDTIYLNDSVWRYYTDTFTYQNDTPKSNLLIYNAGYLDHGAFARSNYTFMWMDDFSIQPLNSIVSFTLPDSITYCDSLADLSQYVSVPGGTFSGSGVSSSGGVYSLNGETAYLGSLSSGNNGWATVTYHYTDAAGCARTAYAQIKIVKGTACCLAATIFGSNPYTKITAGTLNASLAPGNYYIRNNVTITGNMSINGARVAIAPGVTITVAPGVVLTIDSSHLYCCDNTLMWKGMVLQSSSSSSARLNLTNHTLVEDAEKAVYMNNPIVPATGNLILCDKAIFNKNATGIHIENCPGGTSATLPFVVRNTVFTCRKLNVYPNFPYSWPKTDAGTGALKTTYTPANPYLPPYNITNPNVLGTGIAYDSAECNVPSKRFGIVLNNAGSTTPNGSVMNYKEVVIGDGSLSDVANSYLNIFDNLNYGIHCTISNVASVNNAFIRIYPYRTSQLTAPVVGSGSGIYGSASTASTNRMRIYQPATNRNNKFYNCFNAVFMDNYYEFWGNNSFIISDRKNGLTGEYGYNLKSMWYTLVDAKNNNIYNVKYGALFTANAFNLPPFMGGGIQRAGSVNINFNILSDIYNSATAVTNNMEVAIVLQNLLSGIGINSSATGVVRSNNNSITGANNGISVSNFKAQPAVSRDNVISIRSAAGVTRYGISHANCVKDSILKNDISATGSLNDSAKAVLSSFNTLGSVKCNTVWNIGRGFEFRGAEPGMNWRSNVMLNNLKGYMLSAGHIGQQGSATNGNDNKWNGTWSTGTNRIQTFALLSDVTLSKLFTNNGKPTINGSSPNSSCPNRYIFPGPTTPACAITTTGWVSAGGCLGGSSGSGMAMPMSDHFDQLASNAMPFLYEPQKTTWIGQNGTYEAMVIDTTITDSSIIMKDFWNTASGSRFKHLSDIENRLVNGDHPMAQALIANTAAAIAPGNISGTAGAVVADVSNADNIVSNYLTYYSLYLKYQTGAISAADENTLTTLAGLCPYTDGAIVYQARALYNIVFNVVEQWHDEGCLPTGPVFVVDDEEGNNPPPPPPPAAKPVNGIGVDLAYQSYTLYPNPVTDEILLQQNVSDKRPIEVQIYNIAGQKIGSRKLNFKGGKAQIDASRMSPGFYLLYLTDDSGKQYQLKFAKE